MSRVNQIIRGKVNFYLYPFKAVEKNKLHGLESHCYLKSVNEKLRAMDAYKRRRLRVCMIHNHPRMRKGLQMGHKWNIEYFCRAKLVPGEWLYNKTSSGQTIEEYIEGCTTRWKKKQARRIEKLKMLGKEYYTEERLHGIAINKALVTI